LTLWELEGIRTAAPSLAMGTSARMSALQPVPGDRPRRRPGRAPGRTGGTPRRRGSVVVTRPESPLGSMSNPRLAKGSGGCYAGGTMSVHSESTTESPRARTLEDVARLAGVSRNTVSLAIRLSPRVNAATRERVLRIVRETGYRPNYAARALAGRR